VLFVINTLSNSSNLFNNLRLYTNPSFNVMHANFWRYCSFMCLGDKTHNPHTTLNHHVSPFAGCKKKHYKRHHGIALYTPYSTSNIRGKMWEKRITTLPTLGHIGHIDCLRKIGYTLFKSSSRFQDISYDFLVYATKGPLILQHVSMMFDALLFSWKWWHMFYVCCNQLSFVAHVNFLFVVGLGLKCCNLFHNFIDDGKKYRIHM
jgi:hypothetical protein